MRRIIFLLLLSILMTPISASLAAPPGASANDAKNVLTKIRWAVHTDAVTGAKRLRLVFDFTGPVKVNSSMLAVPVPSLILNLTGVVPGAGIGSNTKLDGTIADSINAVSNGKETRMKIDLPIMINDTDYKVFVLRKDPVTKRPDRIVVDINKPVLPANFHFTAGLKGKVIVLDPGHGGSDPGAIGPGKTMEKTITLAVSLKVKALLEKAGAKVIMTRQSDRDVYKPGDTAVEELSARASVANRNKADIFVDVHINSFVNPDVGGTATYYYEKTPYDLILAQTIQSNLIHDGGLENRGVHAANFYVLKHTVMPSVLAELAFISNPKEENLLNEPDFQQKMAQGIVKGIDDFFAQAAKMGGEQ
ncbi:N-acetylmuramoyl-L-alanine amidase family protein [Lucifera butyrica]|uniref:N-acetylmuramoyl-L-alanine amidase family protein n=1 Tax=Lucifera butyrica TaxID=1351585 RepID=UPI001A9EEC97|nr:N-acetylmuramoyl-L-alanine amidase [Lucifera butyrica]